MPGGINGKSILQGWQTYPENLTYRGCEKYGYNFASYRHQLQSDSQRLFNTVKDGIVVKVIEFGDEVKDIVIKDANKLEEYLLSVDDPPRIRMILIPQQGSWGRLVIDEPGFRKIVTRFSVFPPFVDIIRSFGERTDYEDDSHGGFYSRSDRFNHVHETAYLVKHPEEHGRPELVDPWSIRQMGVYHQIGASYGDVFIVVNPSRPFQERLRATKQAQSTPSSGEIHLMLMSCVMGKWRWYTSDVEKRYLIMKDRAQLTQVNGKPGQDEYLADIHFQDTQEIQVIQDKCQQLAHLFGMDVKILQHVKNRLLNVTAAKYHQPHDEAEFMSAMIAEADIQTNRIDNLLERLEGTIALVRTILDFRCLHSLEDNSATTNEISRLSRDENRNIVTLTRRAARDTEIMKILTILALVYLPANFVSSMMGMDYISVGSGGRLISIQFKSEFWVFLVVTAILLILTLGIYHWWIKRKIFRRTTDDEITDSYND